MLVGILASWRQHDAAESNGDAPVGLGIHIEISNLATNRGWSAFPVRRLTSPASPLNFKQ